MVVVKLVLTCARPAAAGSSTGTGLQCEVKLVHQYCASTSPQKMLLSAAWLCLAAQVREMLMPEVVSQVDDDSPFKGKGGKPWVGGRLGQGLGQGQGQALL